MDDNVTILYAEDDVAHATLTKRSFSVCGSQYQILHFLDGPSLLEHLQQLFVDVSPSENSSLIVLLDIKMPGMSGIEVLEKIRSSSHLKGVPVLMLSSSDSLVDVRKCYELGCDGYFTKPMDFDAFNVVSKKLINSIEFLLSQPKTKIKQIPSVESGFESMREGDPLPNCWELSKCGREVGGESVEELGECIAAKEKMGHSCWIVAGTLCGGQIQGSFAQKIGYCTDCEVYICYDRSKGQYSDRIAADFPEEEESYTKLMFKKTAVS